MMPHTWKLDDTTLYDSHYKTANAKANDEKIRKKEEKKTTQQTNEVLIISHLRFTLKVTQHKFLQFGPTFTKKRIVLNIERRKNIACEHVECVALVVERAISIEGNC
jgi:hypothetical protein